MILLQVTELLSDLAHFVPKLTVTYQRCEQQLVETAHI